MSAERPLGPEFMACGFTYCLFDFGNISTDWSICLMAFCCPFIRFAETISRSPEAPLGFWPALAGMLVLFCLEPYTGGLTGVLFLILWYLWRQYLRKVYHHPYDEGEAMAEDCCMLCCCGLSLGCCMLVQEAREVEFTSPRAKMEMDEAEIGKSDQPEIDKPESYKAEVGKSEPEIDKPESYKAEVGKGEPEIDEPEIDTTEIKVGKISSLVTQRGSILQR